MIVGVCLFSYLFSPLLHSFINFDYGLSFHLILILLSFLLFFDGTEIYHFSIILYSGLSLIQLHKHELQRWCYKFRSYMLLETILDKPKSRKFGKLI